ncbi:MAG TPA: regulatory iron-sulfur-containing complex subunit RicT [Trueperaceae bacterium]|nr:regulatory iron-sulfur-containing complex subunit RicT [Trueperaceae bacterium]
MPECIGVRFDNGPKLHYMEAPPTPPTPGTRCVVTTRRGLEVGRVRTTVREVANPHGHYVRDAQQDDLARYEELKDKAEKLKWLLRARARQVGADMKVVALEFTIDESLLVVSYSSEAQPPLRVLAPELVDHTDARIEFVNVGPRDQARMLGTLGVCGDGSCSSTWLQSFNSVSIRMARDQQLPLNPEKISGPCGRLMCCLQYEHEMYRELLKGMPKKGSRGCHEGTDTCGRVVKLNALRGTVELRTIEGAVEEFPAEEITRQRN